MSNKINFGFIKDALVKSSTSLYLNENKLNNDLKDFLNVVKSSPILTLEYIVYKNLENKKIKDDLLATRYIDENISLLKKYTKKEIIEENNKLNKYVRDFDITDDKKNLYESISYIIIENAQGNNYKNIDKLHESFETVLNYIKNESNNLNESKSIFEEYKDKFMNFDFVFKTAVDKFNKKYSHLSEGEKRILKVLIKENEQDKKELYDSLINETLDKVKNLLVKEDNPDISNKLERVKTKLNESKYNNETIIDDIIKLNNLKESL